MECNLWSEYYRKISHGFTLSPHAIIRTMHKHDDGDDAYEREKPYLFICMIVILCDVCVYTIHLVCTLQQENRRAKSTGSFRFAWKDQTNTSILNHMNAYFAFFIFTCRSIHYRIVFIQMNEPSTDGNTSINEVKSKNLFSYRRLSYIGIIVREMSHHYFIRSASRSSSSLVIVWWCLFNFLIFYMPKQISMNIFDHMN